MRSLMWLSVEIAGPVAVLFSRYLNAIARLCVVEVALGTCIASGTQIARSVSAIRILLCAFVRNARGEAVD